MSSRVILIVRNDDLPNVLALKDDLKIIHVSTDEYGNVKLLIEGERLDKEYYWTSNVRWEACHPDDYWDGKSVRDPVLRRHNVYGYAVVAKDANDIEMLDANGICATTVYSNPLDALERALSMGNGARVIPVRLNEMAEDSLHFRFECDKCGRAVEWDSIPAELIDFKSGVIKCGECPDGKLVHFVTQYA